MLQHIWYISGRQYLSMHLRGKRTFKFANLNHKALWKHYASSSFQQYTGIPHFKPSATMDQQLLQEPPDLSTWSADQLIARVNFLEQQLKEQTLKCVCPSAQSKTVLIA